MTAEVLQTLILSWFLGLAYGLALFALTRK